MSFLPTVGGMGSATLAGTYYNKLTPAALLWWPQGKKKQEEPTPENKTNSNTSGSKQPHGINDLPIDKSGEGIVSEGAAKAESLVFHCTTAEVFTVASSVTRFPVDSGFSVSDHVVRQNPTIQIEGVVSNTTMSTMDLLSLGGIIQIGGAILGTPLGGVLGSAIGLGQALSKSKQKANVEYFHETLERFVKEGQLVAVSTMRGLYDNCVVVAYNTRADVDSSTSLHFSITLEKLNIVNALGVPITQSNFSLDDLPKTKRDKILGYKNSIGIGALGSLIGLL